MRFLYALPFNTGCTRDECRTQRCMVVSTLRVDRSSIKRKTLTWYFESHLIIQFFDILLKSWYLSVLLTKILTIHIFYDQEQILNKNIGVPSV